MDKFMERHAGKITGALSCFDRTLFRGYLIRENASAAATLDRTLAEKRTIIAARRRTEHDQPIHRRISVVKRTHPWVGFPFLIVLLQASNVGNERPNRRRCLPLMDQAPLTRSMDSAALFDGVKRFDARLRERAYPGLAYEFRRVEGQGHTGTKAESYNRGVRFAFSPRAPEE